MSKWAAASATFGEGGYGFSLVLSFTRGLPWGCSPGTYPAILAMHSLAYDMSGSFGNKKRLESAVNIT